MAYTIKKSNGGTLILLDDGLADKQVTSLTLVGKNVSNFGDDQNENFVHLLENFASKFEPRSPLVGQIWYNTSTYVARPTVFDGTNWRPIATLLYSNTTTDTLVNAGFNNFVANTPGDFWFNSSAKQLHVITNSGMTLIGPEAVPGYGVTKMSSVKINDTSNVPHPVIEMTVDGSIIGVVSTLTFATNDISPANIYQGVTLAPGAALSASTIWSNTANATTLISGQVIADAANITALTGRTATFNSLNSTLISGNTATITKVLSSDVEASTILGTNITVSNSLISNLTTLLVGNWKLGNSASLTANLDGSNDLGSSLIRFNNVYTKSLSLGSSANAGDITGFWRLTNGSTVAPTNDQGNDLGAPGKRFGTVYASGLSADNGSNPIAILGSPNVSGNITPSVGNLYEIGSVATPWAQLYVDNVQTNAVDSNEVNANTATIANLYTGNASITTLTDAFNTIIDQFDTDGMLTANSDGKFSTQKAIKTYVNFIANGLAARINAIPVPDTDGTLAANSDGRLATQKATKTYVDNKAAYLQSEIDNLSKSGFGNGQRYYNETYARTFGIPYRNTSANTMWVSATVSTDDNDNDDVHIWATVYVDGLQITRADWPNPMNGAPAILNVQFFVPPGSNYYVNIDCGDEPTNNLSYGQSIVNWIEFK
jgi:hypothetical protein